MGGGDLVVVTGLGARLWGEGAAEGRGAEGQKPRAVCLGGRVRAWEGPASEWTGAEPQPGRGSGPLPPGAWAWSVGRGLGTQASLWAAAPCAGRGPPLFPVKTSEETWTSWVGADVCARRDCFQI